MKSDMLNFLAFSLINSHEYSNINYIDDENVNECIMDMYFYMLLVDSDDEEKKEEYYQKFEKKFKDLNNEQQELVRQEYIDIIKAQENNKEKVKKKGMIDYE